MSAHLGSQVRWNSPADLGHAPTAARQTRLVRDVGAEDKSLCASGSGATVEKTHLDTTAAVVAYERELKPTDHASSARGCCALRREESSSSATLAASAAVQAFVPQASGPNATSGLHSWVWGPAQLQRKAVAAAIASISPFLCAVCACSVHRSRSTRRR